MSSQAVKIIDGGKLIIPAAFRRKLGIDTGDTVVIELGEDGLHVRSLSSAVRRAQEIVREFVPDDVSLADDLIAERRV
ncbi:AbrB family transcriptional regulator, partial [Halomonas sp. ND22Bw]|uniref:AbrB/MazE/SpoVT family DNA-binding domain-containing protein n=1 Tax=Halomonas sp. ND22Bw TaxID=2054178 RepID=UPI000D0BA1FE